MIEITKKLLPTNEAEQQKPVPVVQEKPVKQESKIFMTKAPQDIDRLLSYTQQKIE